MLFPAFIRVCEARLEWRGRLLAEETTMGGRPKLEYAETNFSLTGNTTYTDEGRMPQNAGG